MGLADKLINFLRWIFGTARNLLMAIVTPLAMTKKGADDKSDPFAALVHILNLGTMGLYIALAVVPDYVTDNGSSKDLFGLKCDSGDSLDCGGRLMGVKAVTIVAAGLAFFNMACIKMDWYNGAFWSSLYCFGASLTAFFLFYSFNNRPYWIDNNVTHHQQDISNGNVYALSIAGMAVSGCAFLGWTAFEVNFLDSDVTQKIPDTVLAILDAANMILPPNGFTEKIRNIRFVKNTGDGVGVRGSFE